MVIPPFILIILSNSDRPTGIIESRMLAFCQDKSRIKGDTLDKWTRENVKYYAISIVQNKHNFDRHAVDYYTAFTDMCKENPNFTRADMVAADVW